MPTQQATALFENLGDSDWFRVRLVAGQTYQMRISSPNQAASIRVVLPDGQALQIPIAFANSLNFVAPVTGDYFVAASSYGGPVPTFFSITVEDIADAIPASVATPATLAVGETQSVAGNTGGSINNDWFAIDLVAGQSYVLATNNITSRVYFADADGAVVAIEGFFGGGGQQAHFTATETGRFYAGAQHSSGTSYQLSLMAIADDHGDRPADAGSLTVGTPANGRWESGGDDDAYAVVLTAGASYNFAVQNLTDSLHGYIRILDESGGEVWTSYGQAADQTTVFSPDADGTYYAIASFNYVASPGDPPAYLKGWDYALSATLIAGDLTDNALTTGTLAVGGQTAGIWEGPGDRDWLKIDLVEGQSYLFDLVTSVWNGVGLALFDADGNRLNLTVGFTSSGAQLQHTAAATGSYFISALVGMFPGSYTISAAAVADDFANHAGTTGQVVSGIGIGVSENFADTDWFAVDLIAGLTYKLAGDGSGVGLAIRDPDGTLLTQSNGSDLTFTPSATGTYFVEAGGADGDYAFLIAAAADDYVESLATTGVIRLQVLGTNNADILASTDAYEYFVGGGGDDLFIASTGFDFFDGGAGSDTVSYAGLADAVEVDLRFSRSLVDGAQRDMMLVENVIGSAFDDLIAGSGAANRLDGGAGNDILTGFGGNDTFYVDSAGDVVVEAAGQGTDRVATSVSYALAMGAEVEQLEAVNSADTSAMDLTANDFVNLIIGNAGMNLIFAYGGNDTLIGNGGNDFLIGGTGADLMYGGTGNDTFYVDDIGDRAYELAGEGTDRIATLISYTLDDGSEVELLESTNTLDTNAMDLTGSNSANQIIGNAGVNLLFGGGGNDQLVGLNGNDFLIGGAGADLMYGGAGDDTYYVDDLGDQANEVAGQGTADRIATSISYTLDVAFEVELLEAVNLTATDAMDLSGSDSGQTIIGNDGVNILFGAGGNDTLISRAGNDVLVGGAGDDVMHGGSGDDTYHVDSASDQANELNGDGNDRVATSVSYTLAAGSEIETLEAVNGADTSAMNLTGNGIANAITGSAGANVIDGKGGSDVLTGLGGADTFAFTTALGAGNVDRITDFVSGADKIALDDAIFGALGAGAFAFGTAAQDADDRIVYDSATGKLYFDADGNGSGAQVLFATLDGHPVIVASDFTVI